MSSHRTQDSLLALLGILAVAVYVLACSPSFSPDGTKIAFPVFDKEAKQASVLCYDLRTRATQEIFRKTLLPEIKEEKPTAATQQQAAAKSSGLSFGPSTEEQELVMAIQWLSDGKHVVINHRDSITIVPVGSSGPTRTFKLENEVDPEVLAGPPPPVVGQYQFISFKDFLVCVNLRTGDTLAVPNKEELALNGYFAGRIYYSALLGSDEKEDIELGTLNVDSLARTPLFRIKKEDWGDMGGNVAFSRDGTRYALLGDVDDVPQIRIFCH